MVKIFKSCVECLFSDRTSSHQSGFQTFSLELARLSRWYHFHFLSSRVSNFQFQLDLNWNYSLFLLISFSLSFPNNFHSPQSQLLKSEISRWYDFYFPALLIAKKGRTYTVNVNSLIRTCKVYHFPRSTVSSLFCLRYVAPDRDWLLMIDDCCMHSLTLFFQIPQMVTITLFNTAWAQVLPSAGMLTLSQQWHATRWLGDTQTTNIAILSLASLWRPAHLDFIIR